MCPTQLEAIIDKMKMEEIDKREVIEYPANCKVWFLPKASKQVAINVMQNVKMDQNNR